MTQNLQKASGATTFRFHRRRTVPVLLHLLCASRQPAGSSGAFAQRSNLAWDLVWMLLTLPKSWKSIPLLRPLRSQDQLYKHKNFSWSMSRPTATLVTLACVPAFLFIFSFFADKKYQQKENLKEKQKMKKKKLEKKRKHQE